MESPVARFVRKNSEITTRPLFIGANFYQISLPGACWQHLDLLLWNGYDVDTFLEDCIDNIKDETLSHTIWTRLHFINIGEKEENGIELKPR